MNDTYIVTAYVVIDDILKAHGFEDDCRACGTAAEILTVGVMAAKYFQNHHERALGIMTRMGYVHALSLSRFNRRLHALRDWLYSIVSVLTELFVEGKCSSSTVCHCLSASERVLRVARKCAAKPIADIVRLSEKSFSVGVCI